VNSNSYPPEVLNIDHSRLSRGLDADLLNFSYSTILRKLPHPYRVR
jgi:hypothetical protein